MGCRYINKSINIGTMTLKNRIVMTALQTNYAEAGPDGGYVNQRVKDFYFRRAEGGAALLIVGGTATDKYVGYKNMLRIDDDRYIQGFRELADGTSTWKQDMRSAAADGKIRQRRSCFLRQ